MRKRLHEVGLRARLSARGLYWLNNIVNCNLSVVEHAEACFVCDVSAAVGPGDHGWGNNTYGCDFFSQSVNRCNLQIPNIWFYVGKKLFLFDCPKQLNPTEYHVFKGYADHASSTFLNQCMFIYIYIHCNWFRLVWLVNQVCFAFCVFINGKEIWPRLMNYVFYLAI